MGFLTYWMMTVFGFTSEEPPVPGTPVGTGGTFVWFIRRQRSRRGR